MVLDDDEDGGASGSGMDEATYEQLMGRVDDMEIDVGAPGSSVLRRVCACVLSECGVGAPEADDMAIPTGSHIAAARERRTAARKLPVLSKPETSSFNNEEDYISLDVSRSFGERLKEKSGPHPESRLMREDDEVGEGDDGERYTLFQMFSHISSPLALQTPPFYRGSSSHANVLVEHVPPRCFHHACRVGR
jgi:GC-rich sequence DNA-binding factor